MTGHCLFFAGTKNLKLKMPFAVLTERVRELSLDKSLVLFFRCQHLGFNKCFPIFFVSKNLGGGVSLSEEEIESLLVEVDVDCDGVIQYDEFCGLAVNIVL